MKSSNILLVDRSKKSHVQTLLFFLFLGFFYTLNLNVLYKVAMGQGQSEIAVSKLREFAQNGHWLCLKNLHLVTAWLPTLEKELNSLAPHKDFRLWLTAEPHPKFSPILLQSSLKVTYEVIIVFGVSWSYTITCRFVSFY